MGRDEVYEGFWWGNLRERDHVDDLGMDGRVWCYVYIHGSLFRKCCI